MQRDFEDRWRKALEEHERDPDAHLQAIRREAHDLTNRWVTQFQKPVMESMRELREEMQTTRTSQAVADQGRDAFQNRVIGGLVVVSVLAGSGLVVALFK